MIHVLIIQLENSIMSEKYCSTCAAKNSPDAVFCANCGTKMGENVPDARKSDVPPQQYQQSPPSQPQPPQYIPPISNQQPPPQQPPQYQQQPPQYQQQSPQYQQYPPPYQPGYRGFHKPDYIRPPNYVFTTSIKERIIGTLKFDMHVVEEIEERKDLQDEAQKLLLACFSIISVLSIISILSSSYWIVHSPLSTIIEIVLTTFLSGFIFIIFSAKVGQTIGGKKTIVDKEEILRVSAYAYVAYVIERILFLVSGANVLIGLLWVISFFYFLALMTFVLRRAFDTGYIPTIVTIVISLIGTFIVYVIILVITGSIFGLSYEPAPT